LRNSHASRLQEKGPTGGLRERRSGAKKVRIIRGGTRNCSLKEHAAGNAGYLQMPKSISKKSSAAAEREILGSQSEKKEKKGNKPLVEIKKKTKKKKKTRSTPDN